MKLGVLGALGVLFVGLKLGGIINWSWWLVTLPFTASLIIFILAIIILTLAGGVQ